MVRLFYSKNFFLAFLLCYTLLIALYPHYLSISYFEASIFYYDKGYLGVIARFFCSLFGQNDFALRAFFITLHFASLFLFYSISKKVVKQEGDARVALIVFCLLPASSLSALLVMKSSVVVFATLVFIYLHSSSKTLLSFLSLTLFAMLDGAFAILFLSLIFYGVSKKNNALIVLNILLFGVSMSIFGFNDGGVPKSYFLDTLGVYMLIFSPLLFLYFVFSLYKRTEDKRSLGWYISFWALIFSLLLSFRQKIMLYDFAPFVVLAIPFMVRNFFASYRVRIGANKGAYSVGFGILAFSLAFFFVLAFFNHPLYAALELPKKHFAYNYQIAKELSLELKKLGVSECDTTDKEMALRLKFYGIKSGKEYLLSEEPHKNSKKVSIVYSGNIVGTYYVTKVNTF